MLTFKNRSEYLKVYKNILNFLLITNFATKQHINIILSHQMPFNGIFIYFDAFCNSV